MKCFSRCMLLYGGLIFFVAIVAGMEDDKDSIEKITDEENFYDAISDANLNAVDYELLTKYREKRAKRQTKNTMKGNLTKYGSLSESHETEEQYAISTSLQINPISEHDTIAHPLLTINLVRHADKKKEDEEKYSKQEPNKNYEWELDDIKKPGGVMAAYFLGVHFYYKYKDSKIPPLIYTSPFCRCIQTAIPIAKALNTKIKIEYGLFEPFDGFPTEEEIQFFCDGNEKYIDTEYESKYYKIFNFIKTDGSMYELTQNENQNMKSYDEAIEELKNRRYEKRKLMTEYFKNVQREERNDIIIVSHKEELRTIGNLLVDPESVAPSGYMYQNDKDGSKEFKDMRKWETGVLIPYHKKEDGNYEEDSAHYKSKELYRLLRTNKIEEFQKKFGQLEPDAYDYTK